MMAQFSILWRRLDTPGCETARLSPEGEGWELAGTAVFADEGQPCRLDYLIRCDAGWRTRSGWVAGWVGTERIEVRLAAEAAGNWEMNGEPQPAAAGCPDLDLNFSPVTNLLPIRRLNLAVGASAGVRAAWLRFPSFKLEPLEQVYRRTGERTYQYEAGDGAFVRDLEVNHLGFVTRYPDFWEQAAATG
jgi:hypothetical protein